MNRSKNGVYRHQTIPPMLRITASPGTRMLLLALVLFSGLASFAQYNTDNLAPAMEAAADRRFQCEKLRLYPIVANAAFRDAHKSIGQAVPMNKALQDGRLLIKEHQGGATVNTLQAVNASKDTIYLMQGEVVIGGKQDRMLAQDVLIPPGATVDIGAFCVEHGRWQDNGSGHAFTATIGLAGQQARKAAAVDKEQTRVWEEVAKDIHKNATETRSGSYAHLMNDKEFQADRLRYREQLMALPASCIGMVGVIAVSGDKVIGCDVFATEALLAQAYPQLIDAYIAEALNNGAPVTMTTEQMQAYFAALFSDEEKLEEKSKGKGYIFKAQEHTYRISLF
ncbi:MAG: hypothetical protein IPM46_16570 [Flavobacteriales bacterium]|nr:hypothetical protein [Flavobacteriales bacterium]